MPNVIYLMVRSCDIFMRLTNIMTGTEFRSEKPLDKNRYSTQRRSFHRLILANTKTERQIAAF